LKTHVIIPVGIAIRLHGMVADELRSRCEAKEAKEDGNSVRRSPEADEQGSPDGQQEGKRPAGDAGWE
jgi:hypothetical protein